MSIVSVDIINNTRHRGYVEEIAPFYGIDILYSFVIVFIADSFYISSICAGEVWL